ncbi:hypothetical protein [Microtetraspora sp. NBRC 13810]|uniref:hypothetical protein n=1 Tax=Microtetraspora sp. NBRC 13810 TaxID=3030990 RepID=UPI0025574F67|nr:hypothetical protein [Microtetraspora sp. NBRC 13810]
MIVAAAVCPYPPLVVPELAGDAAIELDGLRAACSRAIRGLSRSGAERLVIVGGADLAEPTPGHPSHLGDLSVHVYLQGREVLGRGQAGVSAQGGGVSGRGGPEVSASGPAGVFRPDRGGLSGRDRMVGAESDHETGPGQMAGIRTDHVEGTGPDQVEGAGPGRVDVVAYPAEAAGSLAPWGVDVRVGDGAPVLPLSLTVGRWLVEREQVGPVAGMWSVAYDAAPGVCAALGERLADSAERVALLVMADGSACLTEKAPGYLDPRARSYDEHIRHVLETADLAALAALDPAEADELWFGGRAALQVLAGACRAGEPRAGEPRHGESHAGEPGEPREPGEPGQPDAAGRVESVPRFRERSVYYEDCYGVGYYVSLWTRRGC